MLAMSRLTALASCTVILAALCLGLGPAQAAPLSFAIHPGTLGTNQAYGLVTAYGFTAPTSGNKTGQLTAARIFGKNGDNCETGLGVAFTKDHEINAPIEVRSNIAAMSRKVKASCWSIPQYCPVRRFSDRQAAPIKPFLPITGQLTALTEPYWSIPQQGAAVRRPTPSRMGCYQRSGTSA